MNSATSTIDHFVLSPELPSRVNKYCTVDDIDNDNDNDNEIDLFRHQ